MTETDITIPREAEEAGKQEIERLLGKTVHPKVAHAACTAMLRNWPGMEHLAATSLWISGGEVHLPERINLPLTEDADV